MHVFDTELLSSRVGKRRGIFFLRDPGWNGGAVPTTVKNVVATAKKDVYEKLISLAAVTVL